MRGSLMRSFLFLAIAVVAFAYSAPKALQSWGEEEAQPAASAPRADYAAGRRSGRNVEIPSAVDGHFYVEAEIDGREVSAIVDTGATFVVLRESDARRAGVRVGRSDFTMAMMTANGESYAAPVTLRRVAVEGIEIRDVQAVIVRDDQLGISLLGASFLNQLRRYQVSGNTLTFEN
jgi:aspartyl protease family protein